MHQACKQQMDAPVLLILTFFFFFFLREDEWTSPPSLGLFKGTDDRPRSPPTPGQCVQDSRSALFSAPGMQQRLKERILHSPAPGDPLWLTPGAGRGCCSSDGTGYQQKKQICWSHNVWQKCWWYFHHKFTHFLQIRVQCFSSGSSAQPFTLPMLFHFPALWLKLNSSFHWQLGYSKAAI